jgi:hypothetical protein
MLRKLLYPMHAAPRDLWLLPWLEVLAKHGAPFRCYCCGVMQHPWRPSVFVPNIADYPTVAKYLRKHGDRSIALRVGVSSWCVSCAWRLCGRQMVTRRRWWEIWK